MLRNDVVVDCNAFTIVVFVVVLVKGAVLARSRDGRGSREISVTRKGRGLRDGRAEARIRRRREAEKLAVTVARNTKTAKQRESQPSSAVESTTATTAMANEADILSLCVAMANMTFQEHEVCMETQATARSPHRGPRPHMFEELSGFPARGGKRGEYAHHMGTWKTRNGAGWTRGDGGGSCSSGGRDARDGRIPRSHRMSGRGNVDKGDRSGSCQRRGPYTMSICKAQRQQLLMAKRRIFKADSAVPSQLCWFEISKCLSQKYDPTNKALDLKAVRINEELEARGVDLVLNRKDHMDGLNKIIRENIPMLKDVRELYPLKAFNLKELWLKGNPLCDSFHDPNAYISFVRNHFPQLVILDGQMLSQLRSSTPAVPSTPAVVHRIAVRFAATMSNIYSPNFSRAMRLFGHNPGITPTTSHPPFCPQPDERDNIYFKIIIIIIRGLTYA
uniref:Uncharacterized protein LOC116945277 isoform X3 n=1 Tax=Petromyzon marinus TaxID=7757 RepID=A0AAJ7WZJ0_PETMA|nr:uncharacterized protein LOC116945277 isoform X3 [Petromyzon marinus]